MKISFFSQPINKFVKKYQLLCNGNTYSEGSRTGRLVKLSQKGLFWKTWEGEIIADGIKTTKSMNKDGQTFTSSVANTWSFSIDSKSDRGEDINAIVSDLQTILVNGESVTLNYWSPLIPFPCRGDTSYYVHKIN